MTQASRTPPGRPSRMRPNPQPNPRRSSRWGRRLPRRSARLRFTLLSGALFLLAGAFLLTVTYLFFFQGAHQGHGTGGGTAGGVATGGSAAPLPGGARVTAGNGQFPSQALAAATRSAAGVQLADDRHTLLISSLIALPVAVVLALLLGWYFAGRMLRPVRTITATARRISASNLDQRLALADADEEFRQLGDTLDDLFSRLDAAFTAQRHFVANASHELRTPLTRERVLLQVALGDPSTPEVWRATAHELLAANREQERLIEALLALASSESGLGRRERIDLAAICEDALNDPGSDPSTLDLRIDSVIGPAYVDGDPALIQRLVANLVDNAIGHNQPGGRIQVTTNTADQKAVLTITNTGPVIPSDDIARLFQPFQRLDPSRTHHTRGHGLGLSIVQAIATVHGATIAAHPGPEGGLSVEASFPSPSGKLRHKGNETLAS